MPTTGPITPFLCGRRIRVIVGMIIIDAKSVVVTRILDPAESVITDVSLKLLNEASVCWDKFTR